MLCALPASASAGAASLTVGLAPTKPFHPGERFTITVTASFHKRQLKGKQAYLLSFIQYSFKPCEADVNKELARTLDTEGAYYHRAFSSSPHAAAVSFTAGGAGNRRVCAYLFGRPVRPGSKTKPIAEASGSYSVVK